jgi:hypothetical protein
VDALCAVTSVCPAVSYIRSKPGVSPEDLPIIPEPSNLYFRVEMHGNEDQKDKYLCEKTASKSLKVHFKVILTQNFSGLRKSEFIILPLPVEVIFE